MISSGINCNCSKLRAQIPMMNPKRAKLTQVITRKATIANGCAICRSTKRAAVARMTVPMKSAFVAAAPTYPIVISRKFTGADKSS